LKIAFAKSVGGGLEATHVNVVSIKDLNGTSKRLLHDAPFFISFSAENIRSSLLDKGNSSGRDKNVDLRSVSQDVTLHPSLRGSRAANNSEALQSDEPKISSSRDPRSLAELPRTLTNIRIAFISQKIGYKHGKDGYNTISANIAAAGANDALSRLVCSMHAELCAVSVMSMIVDPSSVLYEQLRTARPSSLPTSAPSCGDGSIVSTDGGCNPCPPGTFASYYGAIECIPCPVDFYSESYGSTFCQECSYPKTTIAIGSTTCDAWGIALGPTRLSISFVAFIVVLLFATYFAKDKKQSMVALLCLPILDLASDYAYW